jgi:broad specificity phosphatase PhoE
VSSKEINLYLVRHGETEGNVDRSIYLTKADHAIRLTPNGIEQAKEVGVFLTNHLKARYETQTSGLGKFGFGKHRFGKIRVWYSPYYRPRETAYYSLLSLAEAFDPNSGIISYREDPFLFEQKAGLFDGLNDEEYLEAFPGEAADYAKHVKFNGRTYARSSLGESRIDVVIRAKPFFGTILRDANVHNIRNAVIFCHGVTSRAINMGWMRYPPEWFDAERNPGNCWVRHIHGNSEKGYIDEGYIFGRGAPLNDPMKTQRLLKGAEDIYMLKPGRPNTIVPPGVKVVDPFAKHRSP